MAFYYKIVIYSQNRMTIA